MVRFQRKGINIQVKRFKIVLADMNVVTAFRTQWLNFCINGRIKQIKSFKITVG